jgi:SAM-dependent methyltransferase
VRVIRTFGEPAKFFKETRIYLTDATGWKYWDMAGGDPAEAGLINRGRREHVYGPQTAPNTSSEHDSRYDGLATRWDSSLGVTDDERDGFSKLVRDLGDFRKGRVLDIGCGTGLSLDLGITQSVRLVGVDPSQAMLNELVRKHPHLAGVHPMTFDEALERRVLNGTRFDLVLALGGAASYLSESDFGGLLTHSAGPIALAGYAAGEQPITADLTLDELAASRHSLAAFVTANGGVMTTVGRFEVGTISQPA